MSGFPLTGSDSDSDSERILRVSGSTSTKRFQLKFVAECSAAIMPVIIMPVMALCYRAPKSDWEAPVRPPYQNFQVQKKKGTQRGNDVSPRHLKF